MGNARPPSPLHFILSITLFHFPLSLLLFLLISQNPLAWIFFHATSSSSIPSSPASHPFNSIPVISPVGELCPIQHNSLTAVEDHSTPQLVVPTQWVGALPLPMVPPLEAVEVSIPSIAQVSSISPPLAPSLILFHYRTLLLPRFLHQYMLNQLHLSSIGSCSATSIKFEFLEQRIYYETKSLSAFKTLSVSHVFLAALGESIAEPHTYNATCRSPHVDRGKHAMDREYQSLKENNTWRLVPLPPGRKTIQNKWVYKVKHKANGRLKISKQDSLLRDLHRYLLLIFPRHTHL